MNPAITGHHFLALALFLAVSLANSQGAESTVALREASNQVSVVSTNFSRLIGADHSSLRSQRATSAVATSTNAAGSNTNLLRTQAKWTRQVLVTEQGASVSHTRLPAWLSPNLNVQEAVRLRLPEGSWLKSTVVGLGYYDTASSNSVLIATVKDSALEANGLTQFIYRDAFRGVRADVRYRFGNNFFEQDVILREQPPSPAEWGLNPDTTLLEVLTETYEPPAITTETNLLTLRKEAGVEVKSADETLRLGGARIVRGQAFALPTGTNRTTASAPVPVAKSLVEAEGAQVSDRGGGLPGGAAAAPVA
jgi:hypothetical protein